MLFAFAIRHFNSGLAVVRTRLSAKQRGGLVNSFIIFLKKNYKTVYQTTAKFEKRPLSIFKDLRYFVEK